MPPLSTRGLNTLAQPRKVSTQVAVTNSHGENTPPIPRPSKIPAVRPNMSATLGRRQRSMTPTISTDSKLPRPSVDVLGRMSSPSRSSGTRPPRFTASQASSPVVKLSIDRKPLPHVPSQRSYTPTSKPLPPRSRNSVARDGSPVRRQSSLKTNETKTLPRWVPSPPDSQPSSDQRASPAAVSPIKESDEQPESSDGRDLSSSEGDKSTDSQSQDRKVTAATRSARLPRLSEIRSQTTSSASSERPHSPCPDSFSQPRPRAQHASGFANHERATASSIALYEPKCTPDLVHIRRGSTHTLARNTSVRSVNAPTFGARRLDDPTDFAALVQHSPTKRESGGVQAPVTPMPLQDDQTAGSGSIGNSTLLSNSTLAGTKSPLGYKAARVSRLPLMSAFDDSTMSLGEDSNGEDGDLIPLRLDVSVQERGDRSHIVNLRDDVSTPLSSALKMHDNTEHMAADDANHQETLDRLEGRPSGRLEAAALDKDATGSGHPQLPSYAQQTTASQRRRSGGHAALHSARGTPGPLRMPSKASSVLGNTSGGPLNSRKREAPESEASCDLIKTDRRQSAVSNLGKVPSSQSRGRTVMSNIKGLFSAKREARSRMPGEDVGPKVKNFMTPRSRKDSATGLPDNTPLARLASKDNNFAVQTIAAFATQVWQEALHKNNSAEQERLFSLATVLLDALANSKEAEKAMCEAQRAAAAAKASYDLTQHSLSRISRLLRTE